MELSDIRKFISTSHWTFAISMPKTPHEYTIREWTSDDSAFNNFVQHIRTHGVEERFIRQIRPYLYIDGLKYWTMGDPVETTIVINRSEINDGVSFPIKREHRSPQDAEYR